MNRDAQSEAETLERQSTPRFVANLRVGPTWSRVISTFITFGWLFLASAASAEESEISMDRSEHRFAIRLALAASQAREDLLVPIPESGPGLSLAFVHRLEEEGWSLESRVSFALLLGFDRYGTTNGVLEPALETSWLHEIEAPDGLTRLELGASVGLREFLGYYGSWDDSHLYWLGLAGAAARARASVEFVGRNLEVDLSLPLVALASRPPRYFRNKISPVTQPGYWLSRFADHPQFTSWHELQAFALRALWKSRDGGWAWDPFIAIDFASFSTPERVTYLSYWLGLEVRR